MLVSVDVAQLNAWDDLFLVAAARFKALADGASPGSEDRVLAERCMAAAHEAGDASLAGMAAISKEMKKRRPDPD